MADGIDAGAVGQRRGQAERVGDPSLCRHSVDQADGAADRGRRVFLQAVPCRTGHPARSPPLEMKIGQELAAPEAVFEAIPELEFDQMANLRAEGGHDRLLHDAGINAEPIPELEFDQALGW